jgi:phosphoribosyl 1,2-cyclic phosphodiesterase
LRFASLGSGSSGNALVVESGRTRLLLDCGFSLRETELRLARVGVDAESIDAVLVTHEHDDHSSGAFLLARRHRIPVYLTFGTLAALRQCDPQVDSEADVRLVQGGHAEAIGELQAFPYTVPHDAREPVQYVLSNGAMRLGTLTDVGCSTPHIEQMLSGCDALVLETNHDLELLRNGSYPPRLKARIAGRMGHLDNGAAGAILARVRCAKLQHVVAAHLSETNNTPALACAALAAALGCERGWIAVATQSAGLDWRELL